MPSYHLAQVNVALAKAPLDSEIMKGFVEQLDYINGLADRHPGFVWRLQDEAGDATALQVFEDERILVNMSVWQDFESLKSYVYTGGHLEVLKARKSWFDKLGSPALALWWIPAGTLPTIADAKKALQRLEIHGATPEAFSFAKPYPQPETEALGCV